MPEQVIKVLEIKNKCFVVNCIVRCGTLHGALWCIALCVVVHCILRCGTLHCALWCIVLGVVVQCIVRCGILHCALQWLPGHIA